jgi:hypothetical protein
MRTVLLAVILLGSIASTTWAQPALRPACDRACLGRYVDRYFDAMQKKDVSRDLFAWGARFTENGVQLPLGDEGLWFGMAGRGNYSFYVPDVETQQVAFLGTVREGAGGGGGGTGTLVAIALRLKIVDSRIAEIEQLVVRPETTLGRGGGGAGGGGRGGAAGGRGAGGGGTGDRVDAMGQPHPVFRAVVPEGERASREELVETANYYFTGLARNDGKGYYPFSDDCERFENGGQTTKGDCKRQFEDGTWFNVVDRIRDRRFVAVDRERGVAFAFVFFDHNRINWTWQMAELFKVEDGLIRRVEAVFHRAPYGMTSGWSTYERSISEEIQSVR